MEIETNILINADPEQVWQVLTDVESYPEWNPFVLSLEGQLEIDSRLEVVLKNGEGSMKFKPKVIEYTPNEVFAWKGKLLVPKLFDGSHYFELEKVEEGTRFIHREEFRGILVWPLLKMIGERTKSGFVQMNEALKARVEG